MKNSGSITLLVLVFGGIFFIILASLVSFILTENRAQDFARAKLEARTTAEAGLEYYKWFLAHYPTDFTNGTGHTGPYVVNYEDTDGNPAGTYSLSVAGSSACGAPAIVDITSLGTSKEDTSVHATLVARYATPSVGTYSVLVNDGSHPEINFNTLANFPALKSTAQTSGVFLPRYSTTASPHRGYHLIFNANGTVTVRQVTSVKTLPAVHPIHSPSSFISDFTLITAETTYMTITLSSNCGLLYVEDNTWIEGTVPSKVTVVAANTVDASVIPEVVLRDNILYTTPNGSASLTVIAEHDILIGPDSPMNMTLSGVFVSVNGAFGRNFYYYPSNGCTGLYEPRGTLTLTGSIISDLPTSTLWTNGCGGGSNAGYQTQTNAIDLANASNPSPFTPLTGAPAQFVSWFEK